VAERPKKRGRRGASILITYIRALVFFGFSGLAFASATLDALVNGSMASRISKAKSKPFSAHPAKQEQPKQETYQFQPVNASQGVNNTFSGMTYRTGPGGTFEKSGPSPSAIVGWTGEAGKEILVPFPADRMKA
jgi:hypothetical protein